MPWPLLTLGVLVGVGVVLHRPVARRLGWAREPTLGAFLGLAVVVALTQPPAPVLPGADLPEVVGVGGCLRSLTDPAVLWGGLTLTSDHGERVGNLLMFVPLTFFATLASRRPIRVAAVGASLPVAVEISQSLLGLGRDCVGSDWGDNCIGALGGVALALVVMRRCYAGRRGYRGDGDPPGPVGMEQSPPR
jgi:hypothetical protein